MRPKHIFKTSPQLRGELNGKLGSEVYGDSISEADILGPTKWLQTAKWHLALSDEDANKILAGYRPRWFEERMVTRAEGPDEMGNIVSHAYRSWYDKEVLRL